jgi:hypothetical protein
VDTTGDALAAGTQPVRIGGNPNHFDGSLDEFRFYDRSLHGSEVSSLHAYESQDRFASGLVAYYPFNGNANDESVYSNHGTVNGATLTTDRFGSANQAYQFDGVNDYIETPSNLAGYGIQNTFTLSSWFQVDNSHTSGIRMIMEDGTNYAYDSIYLGVKPSENKFIVKVQAGSGGQTANDNVQVSNLKDGWNQLVYSYDGSKISLHLNGLSFYSHNTSGNISSGNTNLQFGRRPDGSLHFGGALDDIRIYNRALSTAEVGQLYDQERPPHPLDSINGIALWLDASNVDGQQNTTLSNGASVSEWKDLSGNGNDALGTSFSDLPTIQDSGSQSLVDFDSSQKQSLALADATKLNFGANEDFAYVIVLKTETVADTTEAGVLSNRTGTGGYAGYQLYIKSTGEAYSYLAQTDSYKTVDSNPVNDGKFKIFMSTYDRDSSNIMYLNGLEVGSSDISNIINSVTDYPLEIGHEFFTTHDYKYYFDGEIAEILFFDQPLSNHDRIQVQYYLSKKWGLESNVDSDGDGVMDASDAQPEDPSVSATCGAPSSAQKLTIDFAIPNPHSCGKPPNSEKHANPPWAYAIDSTKVEASSYIKNTHGYHDRYPSLLFDGCANDWYPWTAEGNTEEWVALDLSGTKLVTKLEFSSYPGGNNRAPAQVTAFAGSSMNGPWTQVDQWDSADGKSGAVVHDFNSSFQTPYLKLRFNGNHGDGTHIEIYEMSVYGASCTGG